MADDLDDVETIVRNHDGFENDFLGRVLIRIIRKLRNLEQRLRALEQTRP